MLSQTQRRIYPWLGVLCVFTCIALLSAQAHSADFTRQIFGKYNNEARKFAHFSEFAVATVVCFCALRQIWRRGHWLKAALIAGAVCIGYACLDEIHQSFVPGRTPSVYDVMIDSAGVVTALLGIGCSRLFMRRTGSV